MSVKDIEDSCVLGKTLSIKGADDFNLICELANWASNIKTERRNDFIVRKFSYTAKLIVLLRNLLKFLLIVNQKVILILKTWLKN